jgi:DNA-binding GntR family transcriptional regulator
MKKISPLKKSETLKERIYREIRGLLRSGQIESNNLITASHIAKELGVSRTPVREALLQLASEDFMQAIDGRGFMVKEYSREEIHDYFEARRIIEVYVVGQLVDTISQSDLAGLEKYLAKMAAWTNRNDIIGFLDIDRSFHLHLIQLHGNKFMESITEQVRVLISILGQKTLANPGRMEEVVQEHKLILNAIKAGDRRRAEETVDHHLKATEDLLLEKLKTASEDA